MEKQLKQELGAAERKLEKAELKLTVAREKHGQVLERGKQRVQKARLKSAEKEEQSSHRIERRIAAVALLEERVLALSGKGKKSLRQGKAESPMEKTVEAPTPTPSSNGRPKARSAAAPRSARKPPSGAKAGPSKSS